MEHLTQAMLWAVSRGERPASDLLPFLLAHTLASCGRCHDELARFLDEVAARGGEAFAGNLFAHLRSDSWEGGAARDAEEDPGTLLEELLALPAAEREAAARRRPACFQGVGLAEALLERCWECLPADLDGAERFARLALAVVEPARPSRRASEVYLLALAHAANVERARGHLREAETRFSQVRFLLRSLGPGGLLFHAEIDRLEGSLRRAQRRFSEAEELLIRAEMAYRLEGDAAEVGRTLLVLGHLHHQQGEVDRALGRTREALEVIDAEAEPRLSLMAWHNLAFWLCDAGEFLEAKEAFRGHDELYRRFPDPWTQLRRAWLEGRIARGLGEIDLAEGAFLAARDGFLTEKNAYDAALVSLELASLYLDQGRTPEIRRLVAQVLPVFAALEIYREALAALLLFEEATRRDQVSHDLVARLATFLNGSRRDPGLRFRP
jgi:tetratricopeptide (TPR) repeat protein